MRIIYMISIFIFSSSVFLNADEHISYMFDKSKPPEHIVDIIHIEAHVEFEPFKHKVSAHTIFQTVSRRSDGDSVIFYAPDFEFSSVKINNKDARNHFSGNNIVVFFDETLKFGEKYKIEFEYSVVPQQGGIFFVGWNDTTNRHRKQIWAHRPDGWLPTAQDLVLTDFYIKFDKDYKVMTNGIRVDVEDTDDGDKIWHYQMKTRHPYFSTALVIGKYEYKTLKTKSGLSEELWYYPEYEDRFDATYEFSTEMIDFFEEEFGAAYPYELYRQ
ncbi:MAG: hypothetical protein KAH48_06725, partial [Chlorobi bacterium]|nr:hypothetical protein [Chlorobiota bacterium]